MTARDRRVLLVGSAIVVLALSLRVGGAGLRSGRAKLEGARRVVGLAVRARTLVAEGPARQALLRERATAIVDLAPLLLPGSSEVEAAAALAGALNALAGRHRVAIARLDAVPDSRTGVFTRIELRLHAESDLPGLYGFIHAVESGPLLLSFIDLAITAQDGAAPVERLRLEAAVRGWAMRGSAKAEVAEGRETGLW
jgi:hypothetical protein